MVNREVLTESKVMRSIAYFTCKITASGWAILAAPCANNQWFIPVKFENSCDLRTGENTVNYIRSVFRNLDQFYEALHHNNLPFFALDPIQIDL